MPAALRGFPRNLAVPGQTLWEVLHFPVRNGAPGAAGRGESGGERLRLQRGLGMVSLPTSAGKVGKCGLGERGKPFPVRWFWWDFPDGWGAGRRLGVRITESQTVRGWQGPLCCHAGAAAPRGPSAQPPFAISGGGLDWESLGESETKGKPEPASELLGMDRLSASALQEEVVEITR